MLNDPTENCRVCGWPQGVAQHGPRGSSPSFEFCECCGVEFGYGDVTITGIINHRESWLQSRCQWHDPEAKPKNWKLEDQFENVKPEYLLNNVTAD